MDGVTSNRTKKAPCQAEASRRAANGRKEANQRRDKANAESGHLYSGINR